MTGYLVLGRAHGAPGDARVQPGRLRLHDLHRQLRTARRGRRGGHRGERPRRRGGAVGQSQLRGPHPSAGPRELPRVAAAGRGLRAGRPGRHRPDHASRSGRAATGRRCSSPTSGRRPRRSARSSADAVDAELFRRTYAVVFEGDERWRALLGPLGRPLRLGPGVDLCRTAAVPRWDVGRARARRRHRRRSCPGRPRRLGHDRPHLPGRLDRRRGRRPASGSRTMASGRSNSTRMALDAASTR